VNHVPFRANSKNDLMVQFDRLAAVTPCKHGDGDAKYCSLAFEVVTPLLKALSGVKFEHHLKRTLFDPLGLNGTGYWTDALGSSPLAKGHQTRRAPNGNKPGLLELDHALDNLGRHVGFASCRLITTAPDLVGAEMRLRSQRVALMSRAS
jgi:CubicO group peptidase (beta-lactamase class C family)